MYVLHPYRDYHLVEKAGMHINIYSANPITKRYKQSTMKAQRIECWFYQTGSEMKEVHESWKLKKSFLLDEGKSIRKRHRGMGAHGHL